MYKVTNLLIVLLLTIQSFGFSINSTSHSSFEVQRVKLKFTTPEGYVRHLTIGFTPSNIATDGFDYGFDTAVVINYDDDLNWIIDDYRYIIQGVGSFDTSKKYPMGMFLTNSGEINIDLISLENFDSEINVFIHDALENTYTKINQVNFTKEMNSGEYKDRFFIAFEDPSSQNQVKTLSTETENIETASIKYVNNIKQLKINSLNNSLINTFRLYNINGQIISEEKINNTLHLDYNTSTLSSGTYIVNVKTTNGIASKLIAIN